MPREPKNILIFSDGTGQAGGLHFDEHRSNIYKHYRATRVGPDSRIDPAVQVAFYDPGLGSQADGARLWGRGALRGIYNIVSQATGFGITANIIDCYAAIIRLYEDGDRIFLFGFSRGAYTARCIGGVLAYCGVPRHLPDNKPLKLDATSSQALAAYAVKHIYQFTESRPKTERNAYQRFLHDTRDLMAKDFRERHGANDATDRDKANVYPHFIGVFDTVAALGNWKKFVGFFAVFIAAALAVSFNLAWLFSLLSGTTVLTRLEAGTVFFAICTVTGTIALFVYLYTHIKFNFNVPGYTWMQKLKTFHVTAVWQKFYDTSLNRNVNYAKHAISIDENRADFRRVEWGSFDSSRPARDRLDNPWFEQVWFAGSHSDVGGSYPENESRLSDVGLKWMLACASVIPDGIVHDPAVLRMHPDSAGMQHDERKAGLGFVTRHFKINWRGRDRNLKPKATMHKSVYERFDLREPVLQHDVKLHYRPASLREHDDFKDAYTDDGSVRWRENDSRSAVAVNTEYRFDQRLVHERNGSFCRVARAQVNADKHS